MTMAAAQNFVKQVLWNHDLVDRVNAAPDQAALTELLAEQGLSFNYDEFEAACRYWLTQSQTHEQAQAIEEIKLWWHCLGHALQQ